MDVKHDALETAASMGAFARENYDSVSQLNKEMEEKEQELQKSKQDQEQVVAHHQQEL